MGDLPKWAQELLPISILLIVIIVFVSRLPRIDVGHSDAYRRRRVFNWLPLGLTYAMLYFGRYNLKATNDIGVITSEQYGIIFGVGAMVYGLSFFLNGPLADRWGGRRTILISAMGSGLCNLAMGVYAMMTLPMTPMDLFTSVDYFRETFPEIQWHGAERPDPTVILSILFGMNMYFQSFGAVSIVKVNSAWFHVRERGVFGGIFGILISLGIYFAFDWGHRIANGLPHEFTFLIPGGMLLVFWMIDFPLVRDSPGKAGHKDFDTGDASSGDDGPPLPAITVMKRMLSNPIILTIAFIEFCSGYLRNAIMHWYRNFGKGMGLFEDFVYQNWGMLLCVAGMFGGMFAGVISDRVFQSRRGPVAGVLYGLMLVGSIVCIPLVLYSQVSVGWVVILMSMAIIGVHGMLSGTASADFGGKKNAGIAVGIIDGFVYFGTVFQSFLFGFVLPAKGTPEATDPNNWKIWPIAMIPVALMGLLLSLKVWNAKPKPRALRKDNDNSDHAEPEASEA